MRLLIDGDIIVYRCAFAAEKTKYLNQLFNPHSTHAEYKEFDTKKEATDYATRVGATNYLWSRKDVQPVENALEITRVTLAGLRGTFDASEFQIFLTGEINFRETVAVTRKYKGNREQSAKPIYYQEVRNLLVQDFGAEVVEGYEADDSIAHEATSLRNQSLPYCIVTTDKDFDQIPGEHYNWVTKEQYNVPPKDAKAFFFKQWLSGDTVDNIPGIPGWGPAKASKWLEACKSPDDMVRACVDAYKENFPDNYKDMAVEQARLVYIRKKLDEDWTVTKEGKLALSLLGEGRGA